MGTWVRFTIRLDPWSYENLLLRQAVLKQTKDDISRAGTLRYILRRLRFTEEQRLAFASAVRRQIAENEPQAFEALLEQELNTE